MIHVFSVAMEFNYDDEDGEYPKPTLKEIEKAVGGTLTPLFTAMGFTDVHIEAGKGNISDVFGG